MNWILRALWSTAWALWLGGVMAIMIMVQRLFQYDRNVALVAAPQMFLLFERYQVVLAIVAMLALLLGEHRKRIAPVAMTTCAFVIAMVSAFIITPRIESLRESGQTDTSAFRALHGASMSMYLLELICLVLIGILIARPRHTRPDSILSGDRQ